MRRGFCNQQEYETTADSHNTSGLTNFSNELDSSLIKNQQRQFSKLVSSQVNELKKVSSITSKSAKRSPRCAGTRSKTSARNVRFSPRNRPGFCDTPSGTELIESGSSLQTDCEEDIENNLNRPLVTFERCEVPNPCEGLYTPQSTSRVTNRRNNSPRCSISPVNCSPCSSPQTNQTNQMNAGTFPDCELNPRRPSHKLLILLLLLLLLLVLLSVFANYLLSCKGDAYNDCSPDGTVRYVPY